MLIDSKKYREIANSLIDNNVNDCFNEICCEKCYGILLGQVLIIQLLNCTAIFQK